MAENNASGLVNAQDASGHGAAVIYPQSRIQASDYFISLNDKLNAEKRAREEDNAKMLQAENKAVKNPNAQGWTPYQADINKGYEDWVQLAGKYQTEKDYNKRLQYKQAMDITQQHLANSVKFSNDNQAAWKQNYDQAIKGELTPEDTKYVMDWATKMDAKAGVDAYVPVEKKQEDKLYAAIEKDKISDFSSVMDKSTGKGYSTLPYQKVLSKANAFVESNPEITAVEAKRFMAANPNATEDEVKAHLIGVYMNAKSNTIEGELVKDANGQPVEWVKDRKSGLTPKGKGGAGSGINKSGNVVVTETVNSDGTTDYTWTGTGTPYEDNYVVLPVTYKNGNIDEQYTVYRPQVKYLPEKNLIEVKGEWQYKKDSGTKAVSVKAPEKRFVNPESEEGKDLLKQIENLTNQSLSFASGKPEIVKGAAQLKQSKTVKAADVKMRKDGATKLTGQINPSTLKKGQKYEVNGTVYTWNGTNLE